MLSKVWSRVKRQQTHQTIFDHSIEDQNCSQSDNIKQTINDEISKDIFTASRLEKPAILCLSNDHFRPREVKNGVKLSNGRLESGSNQGMKRNDRMTKSNSTNFFQFYSTSNKMKMKQDESWSGTKLISGLIDGIGHDHERVNMSMESSSSDDSTSTVIKESANISDNNQIIDKQLDLPITIGYQKHRIKHGSFIQKSIGSQACIPECKLRTVEDRIQSDASITQVDDAFDTSSSNFKLNFQMSRMNRNSRLKLPTKSPSVQEITGIVDSSTSNGVAMITRFNIPNSISLYDQRTKFHDYHELPQFNSASENKSTQNKQHSEILVAQMLLNLSSDLNVKDDSGYTVLMHAVLVGQLPVVKCLLANGASLDTINNDGRRVIDLLCSESPNETRVEMLKLLLDYGANIESSQSNKFRLLDRLIAYHDPFKSNKLPYIECLIQNGAKLGSTTWNVARTKFDIFLKLVQKVNQDGYFLYKNDSIINAIYRFEYALKRIAEFQRQLDPFNQISNYKGSKLLYQSTMYYENIHNLKSVSNQLEYQANLGLSRCELKRKFFKRGLEFAHQAILIDSTAYEAYYSKAHLLKAMGKHEEALQTTNQASRLVTRMIDVKRMELEEVNKQCELSVFRLDISFAGSDRRTEELCSQRQDIESMICYLDEARKFIRELQTEIELQFTNKQVN